MPAATAADPLLDLLARTGTRVRRVRYRANRTVLLSLSRDGRTLNAHECFREAPPRIRDAVALFVTARRGSRDHGHALDRIQGWDGAARGLERARRQKRRRALRANVPEDDPLRALFDRFNQERFGGRLPAIPLRVSHRMTRALGTIAYAGADGDRSVREIALCADLLLPRNEGALRDTLLHEMAHAEAWLRHGHRGHGAVWRRTAERVGCVPRALTRMPIRRSRR